VRPVTVTPARRKMSASDERRFFRWITHSVGDRGFPVYNEHVRGERMGRRAQINNWWFAFAFATSFAGAAPLVPTSLQRREQPGKTERAWLRGIPRCIALRLAAARALAAEMALRRRAGTRCAGVGAIVPPRVRAAGRGGGLRQRDCAAALLAHGRLVLRYYWRSCRKVGVAPPSCVAPNGASGPGKHSRRLPDGRVGLSVVGACAAVHHDGAAALALQEGRSRGAGAESAGAGGAGDAPGFLQRLHLAGRRGAFLRDAGLHLLLPWPPLAPRVVEVWDDVLDAPSRSRPAPPRPAARRPCARA
jgi:hypothetical protein